MLLLTHARLAASRFGIGVGGVSVDFVKVMDHVRASIQHIAPVDSIDALEDASVVAHAGTARFTGTDSAQIDGRPVRFRQALVATGASPAVPTVPGLSDVDYLTSETVWALAEVPTDLVVLGGEGIGCELGQALDRLGSSVSVIEGAARILPREGR